MRQDLSRHFLLIAAISGLLAVALGAMGAHALQDWLTDKTLVTYQTAVEYHFYHTLALLAVALLARDMKSNYLWFSGLFFIAGLCLFSGSLYIYALTRYSLFAMLAPVGGSSFMLAWIMLAIAIYSSKTR